MNEIIFKNKHIWDTYFNYILQDPINESAAILLCKISISNNHKRAIVVDIMLPEKYELVHQSPTYVAYKPSFINKVIERCIKENLHPIDGHDHPFSISNVAFSPIDDNAQYKAGLYINKCFENLEMGFIVIGKNPYNIDARIWNRKTKTIEQIDKIKIITNNSLELINLPQRENLVHTNSEYHNRTMIAVGKETQTKFSQLTIAVVGAGGLGAPISEQLARLGVKKIVCVDNDSVSESNLNRLQGATINDAKQNNKKVNVLARNIELIHPDTFFEAVDDDFLTIHVQEQCSQADIIVGAVDNIGTRFAINRLALAHCIPYFDAGCGGKTENLKLVLAQGQVLKIIPGNHYCLECGNYFSKEQARIDLLATDERGRQIERGYVEGLNYPQPSVYSWNSNIVSNLIWLIMRYISQDCPDLDGIATNFLEHKTWSWKEEPKNQNECITCNQYYGTGNEAPLLVRQNPIESIENIPTTT